MPSKLFVSISLIMLMILLIHVSSFKTSLARNKKCSVICLRAKNYKDFNDYTPLTPKDSFRNILTDSNRVVAGVIVSSGLSLLPLQYVSADTTASAGSNEVLTPLGPAPTDFGLAHKDFYVDCQQVVNHMRYAVQIEKGNPILAQFAQKTKDEMNDFVSYYRRFTGIAGKQSFSLAYTSINVLAGHYTSYGTKFPVPEKRRKRLLQEFNDIEKNIRKRR